VVGSRPESGGRAARVWRVAFAIALVGTFVAALLPAESLASFSHQDKLMHAVAFAVLAWLGWYAGFSSRAVLFGLLVAFGLAIEVAQSFTATRQAEVLDLVADAVGAGLALLALRRPTP
jgi:VanZ like family